MNSQKGVIRIIKKADHPGGYDEYYYFAGVETDTSNHLMATCTSNIWQAMKFMYNLDFEDEMKRINTLIEFIKVCYIPKKQYKIEFIPIKIEY
jgi:hypothetical protein